MVPQGTIFQMTATVSKPSANCKDARPSDAGKIFFQHPGNCQWRNNQCDQGTVYGFQDKYPAVAKAAWEQQRKDSGVEAQTEGHSDEGKHESAQDDFPAGAGLPPG